MKRVNAGVMMSVVLLFIGVSLQAEIIEINIPTDDAKIRGGSYSDTNYGNTTSLVVNNQPSSSLSWARKSYIRFDTSTITNTVTEATFELSLKWANSNNVDITVEVYGLKDCSAGETTWKEGDGTAGSGITWNNAPANDTSSGSAFTSDAILLGTITVPANAPQHSIHSLSTSALVDFLNSDTNDQVTIMINNTYEYDKGISFSSKEYSSAPAPKLSVTVVPEPATIGLLTLGFGFLRKK